MSLFALKAADDARLSGRMAIPVAKIYVRLTAGGPRRVQAPLGMAMGTGGQAASNAPFKEKRREIPQGGLSGAA